MNSTRLTYALLLLAILVFAKGAGAHAGPPFPLFEDQKLGNYTVSLWTDPDVGTALFYVIVKQNNHAPLPADMQIKIGVQPVSGRLPEAFYSMIRENVQSQTQYRADVHFDAQELWRVRVRVESAQGNFETLATVEATPPGYGRWDLLLYLLPFLAVGFLWAIAIIRKTKSHTATR